MREALELINSNNKIFNKIFREIDNKYKKYGKITGSFTIKAKDKDDIILLSNFDSNVIVEGKAQIRCKLVEELFNRKLKEASFIELVEYVVGNELRSNKEVKSEEKNKKIDFYEDVLVSCSEGIGKEWLIYSLESKKSGYNQISRKYNEMVNKEIGDLKQKIILTVNSINNLPYLSGTFENISVFAAKNTKDPHFFDVNTYTGNLLIHGIHYVLCTEEISEQESISELNELYYEVGLLKDEISNNTTIYGLKAFDSNDREISAISEYNKWKEPLQISISNLLKVKYFSAKNDNIFIFENPAVFHKILKSIDDDTSIICTSGQLNLSSYMILNKIKNSKNIYYAGDFDPEGLDIAYKLKNKYKEKIKFLLYDPEIYIRIKSENNIDERRLKILEKVDCKDLKEIKEEILRYKKAGYQELLIEDYISTIKNIISK